MISDYDDHHNVIRVSDWNHGHMPRGWARVLYYVLGDEWSIGMIHLVTTTDGFYDYAEFMGW